MIPIKLKMRNFMCYRGDVPPLSFDSIHTACICGDNGNGKSALIDAMTWAVWGQTRARSDDDLVHSGETEMEVEFDFAVGQQGYRVIRKHARPRRRKASGQSSLDLFIAGDDGFKTISAERIRLTEQKINDILHMDYDTFINSAFLRQGHADEFTQQPPSKRKEVLGNILGLAVYDELEELAKEQAKQRETERAQLDSNIAEIAAELDQKPAYLTELEQVQTHFSAIEKLLGEQKSRLDNLRAQKESLERMQIQLTHLEEHTATTQGEIARWEEQINQHRSRLNEYEELIARRSGIEEGYTRLTEVKALNDELSQKLRQSAALSERRHQMEMTIQQAQAALLSEHKLFQSKILDLDNRSQKLPQLKSELQRSQLQLSPFTAEEETLRQRKQDHQELQKKVNYLQSSNVQLQHEIEDVEGKLKMLLTQTEATCPLCESELGEEGLSLIKTKYTGDKEQKASALESNQAQIARQTHELESQANEIAQQEKELSEQKATLQGNARVLGQQIAEAEEASRQLNEERIRLAEIEEQLAGKDFAPTEQQTLSQVESELAELDYDAQLHEQVRQRLDELKQYEEPKRRLDDAERMIAQEKDFISRAEENNRELRRNLEADSQKKPELMAELGSMSQVASDLDTAESEHQSQTANQKEVAQTMWGIKAKIQRCDELEEKKKEKETQLGNTAGEEQIYRELAQAFGKGGIQAMIIETALPEIEIEANRLLRRMTDNRMQVKMETQRETKRGSVMETLDINISDEMGLRNYEMFSGGEAFRINFAIRIALSKLLAHRAGAPLPTLIIDEGFGTQDATGIEKLKEAINSIQDDFQKILVITHMEEFKDAFPTRISVTKTADGSTMEVS
ncbi:AAA family ATPase [Chloroflexota bacterium]